MSPDIENYRRFVAHFDIPDEQKIELIHAVWKIMQSFVDRAFDDDPVQLVLKDNHPKSVPSNDTMIPPSRKHFEPLMIFWQTPGIYGLLSD